MKRLSDNDEAIAKALHDVPGTKLKFESKLTDKDLTAFKDEMKIELRAIAREAEDEILKQIVKSIQVVIDSEWVDEVFCNKCGLPSHAYKCEPKIVHFNTLGEHEKQAKERFERDNLLLASEEKDFDYSLGNIILADHIRTETRVKMIKEVFEIHGYTQLAKSKLAKEVCSGTLKCPEIDALGELNFVDETAWNIAVNDYCDKCQGKAKRSKEDVMKILKREAWLVVGPDAKGFLTEHRMEQIADQIIEGER